MADNLDQRIHFWEPVSSLDGSHPEFLLVATGNSATVAEIRGRCVYMKRTLGGLSDPSHDGHDARVSSVQVIDNTAGVAHFATGSYDQTIKLWKKSLKKSLEGEIDKAQALIQSSTIYNYRVLAGHLDNVECISASTRDELIFSSSADKTIKIWEMGPDVQTGMIGSADSRAAITTLHGHSDSVCTLDCGKEGLYGNIFSGSDDNFMMTWDLQTKQCISKEENECRVKSVDSDLSSLVAVGNVEGKFLLYDVRKRGPCKTLIWDLGKNFKSGHLSCKWKPNDPSKLLTSFDKCCKIWDIRFPSPPISVSTQESCQNVELGGELPLLSVDWHNNFIVGGDNVSLLISEATY